MIYGYARVSTRGQSKDGNSLEAQQEQLRAAGATIIYSDAFTGTKIDRPELAKLLNVITSGDRLIVTKLDRISRTAGEGFKLIEDLISRGIVIHVLNMGILDDSSTGRLIRHILLAFSEFERDLIVTRTAEGKFIAKQRADYKEGRPRKYNQDKLNMALSLLSDHSYSQVSELTGISKSTLIRAKRSSTAILLPSDE